MKSTPLTIRCLQLAALLLFVASPLSYGQTLQLATAFQDQAPADTAPQISQRQALELVRARFSGNVVSINEVQQGGVLQYRVRMDNEGNIFTVYVNATTGAITREQ